MTAMSARSALDAENPFPEPLDFRVPETSRREARSSFPITRRFPNPRFGDYSRARLESRVAFGGPDEREEAEDELIATPTRQFSLLEVTSGLPDDSREADEHATERRLKELRERVEVARTIVATTPGLEAALRRDWRKAALFYGRFGITESSFRLGLLDHSVTEVNSPVEESGLPVDAGAELHARRCATLYEDCPTKPIRAAAVSGRGERVSESGGRYSNPPFAQARCFDTSEEVITGGTPCPPAPLARSFQ
jgi:hypothetical protein